MPAARSGRYAYVLAVIRAYSTVFGVSFKPQTDATLRTTAKPPVEPGVPGMATWCSGGLGLRVRRRAVAVTQRTDRYVRASWPGSASALRTGRAGGARKPASPSAAAPASSRVRSSSETRSQDARQAGDRPRRDQDERMGDSAGAPGPAARPGSLYHRGAARGRRQRWFPAPFVTL